MEKLACRKEKLVKHLECHSKESSVFKRVGLHYLKRSAVPKVTKAQVMKSRLLKFRLGIFKPSSPVVIVMYDECYFSLSGEFMAKNRGYYTDGSNPVARNVQCRGKRKFPPRILLWCPISYRRISKPFLHEGGTFTNVLYQDNKIKPLFQLKSAF